MLGYARHDPPPARDADVDPHDPRLGAVLGVEVIAEADAAAARDGAIAAGFGLSSRPSGALILMMRLLKRQLHALCDLPGDPRGVLLWLGYSGALTTV
jgi:undecaprenyl-diphosphatase